MNATGPFTRRVRHSSEWKSRERRTISIPRATSTSPSVRMTSASGAISSGEGSSVSEMNVR